MKMTNSRLMPEVTDFSTYGEQPGLRTLLDRVEELVGTLSATEDADDLAVSDIAYTSTLVGTSTSANALAVGPAGTTNPMLKVNCATTDAATGLSITGAAAAGGVALAVISSGTNENLTIDAKGSGTITLNATGTGGITLTRAVTCSSTLGAGATTVTSSGASALTVGANGATNPVLKIDASTASVATGLSITGAAAAAGVAMAVISSGTNENLTIDAKGSGTITLGGTSTGAITLTRAATFSAGCTISADSTLSDGVDLAIGTSNGTKIGTAANQKIGFFNATPVVQPASASQAAVTNTTTTTSTTTALTTDLDAVRVLVNQLRAELVEIGLIKGSA